MPSETRGHRVLRGTALLSAALWAGSLWFSGYVAAPVLFSTISERMLAGLIAGNLFTATAYIGLVCGGILITHLFSLQGRAALRDVRLWLVMGMLLLDVVGQFGLQPQMAALKAQVAPADIMHSELASRFGMLHGIASLMHLAASLLAALLLHKINRCLNS